MNVPDIGEGLAFGIGMTNYRVGTVHVEGGIDAVAITPTPETPEDFFAQTANRLLIAANNGSKWAVMGVPGPVNVDIYSDGLVDQNFRVTQIPALSRAEGFDPIDEMIKADSATDELFRSPGFNFLIVNDGDLASQAAAYFYGRGYSSKYNVIADLINGSGTGGSIVRRDKRFPDTDLFHPDAGLWEVGHKPISPAFPSRTLEQTISGPAVEKHIGGPTTEMSDSDPVYKEVARGMGSVILDFALNGGADLVVISGGFALNTQKNYEAKLRSNLEDFANSRNPMADKLPDIEFVDPSMGDQYELFGARGAMRSFVTQRSIDAMIREGSQE